MRNIVGRRRALPLIAALVAAVALPAIASLGSNSTYDTQYETRNVLFVAR